MCLSSRFCGMQGKLMQRRLPFQRGPVSSLQVTPHRQINACTVENKLLKKVWDMVALVRFVSRSAVLWTGEFDLLCCDLVVGAVAVQRVAGHVVGQHRHGDDQRDQETGVSDHCTQSDGHSLTLTATRLQVQQLPKDLQAFPVYLGLKEDVTNMEKVRHVNMQYPGLLMVTLSPPVCNRCCPSWTSCGPSR